MRERRGLDWALLGAVLVLAFLLSRVQASSLAGGRTDPASQAIRAVFMPVGNLLRRPAQALAGGLNDIVSAGHLRAENDRLRREMAGLRLEAGETDSLRRENARLKEILQAPNYGRKVLSADIVAYFPFQQRITLNRGTAHGVKAGQAIVSDGALLGVVQTVESGRSQALLISSPVLSVGAAVKGEFRVAGIARGQRPGRLVFDFVDPYPVKPGASVETSGFSDTIPAGIPIGDVSEVRDDRDYGTRRAFIVPLATVGSGREVLIIQ
mgnify:CR=1 FL=1